MKKSLYLLVALFVSANVFADHAGDYVGKGYWKAADGSKGTWTMTSKITNTSTGVAAEENLTITMPDGKTHTMNDTYTVKFGKNAFAEVIKKGAVVGTGYCGYKQCHLSGEENGDKWEETLTFHKNKVYRIGSHTSKTENVMWQGTMKKVKAKKAKACADCGNKCECGNGCDCDAEAKTFESESGTEAGASTPIVPEN